MEWLKINFFLLLISFSALDGIAQDSFEIEKSYIKNGRLNVTFINPSKSNIMVPRLSYRYDLSSKTKYLDDSYYEINGDTLVITMTKDHPAGLIDSEGTKAKGSKVEFNDALLKPGKKFRSRVMVNIADKDLRFLKIKYDAATGFQQLCIE